MRLHQELNEGDSHARFLVEGRKIEDVFGR